MAKVALDDSAKFSIDLDNGEATAQASQWRCQSAASGPNFYQLVGGAGSNQSNDLVDNFFVYQVMLPESLTGIRGTHGLSVAESRIATLMAASRLPGFAFPLAARSVAVPWSTDVLTMGKPSVMLTISPNPSALMTGSP